MSIVNKTEERVKCPYCECDLKLIQNGYVTVAGTKEGFRSCMNKFKEKEEEKPTYFNSNRKGI